MTETLTVDLGERATELDERGDGITANHFGSARVTAEIRAGDVAFETSGCGEWRIVR